jgi:hypothetical protein
MKRVKPPTRFALCVRTQGAEDLEPRKLYQILPDRAADREGYVRVVDESGEDYLYPADCFVPVRLPVAVVRNLEGASRNEPANIALHPTPPRRSRAASRRG